MFSLDKEKVPTHGLIEKELQKKEIGITWKSRLVLIGFVAIFELLAVAVVMPQIPASHYAVIFDSLAAGVFGAIGLSVGTRTLKWIQR